MTASAEFLIDIQQRASGNAVSMLDQLSSRMDNAIAHYKSLESASLSAQKRMDSVGAKLGAAKMDLGAAVKIGDTAGAAKANNAIAKLTQDEAKLKQEAAIANAELKKQAAVVGKLADQKGAMEKHAKTMEHAEKQAETLGSRAKKLGNAFGGLPGPLGQVGQRVGNAIDDFSDLKSSFGTAGAAAAVTAVALVALALALAYGAAKATYFALSMANAQRNTALTVSAIVGGNEKVAASFQSITNETGIGSDRLTDITRSLQKAGVAAGDMPTALHAIAEQESALGDSSGTQELIDNLKSGKTTIDELSKDMDSKFGSIVEKKMLGLDQQVDRLKAGFGNMFATLHIESFLKAFKTVVDLFDSSTAAGKQMQATFATIFQPLVDGATSAMPSVRRMILYAELGVVEFLVALDPVAVSIRNAFRSEAVAEFVSFLTAGAGDATALSVIFGLLKFQIDGIVAALGLATNAMKQFSSTKAQPGSDKFGNLTASASSLPGAFQSIGQNVSAGLAAGIDSGAGAVDGSVQSIVSRAIAQGKAGFDQHSPSKEFEHIGDMNVAGLVGAHERGANDVEASIEHMAQIPSLAPPGRAGGSGSSLHIEKIEINVTGGGDQNLAMQIREEVKAAIVEASLEIGLDVFGEEDAA